MLYFILKTYNYHLLINAPLLITVLIMCPSCKSTKYSIIQLNSLDLYRLSFGASLQDKAFLEARKLK